jgi:hypothetical protein
MKTVSARQQIVSFLISAGALGLIAFLVVRYQVSLPMVTRDVTAIAGLHPLAGALSSFGILLWCAAAVACAFAAMVLRGAGRAEEARFLAASAVLSVYLMFDDLFGLHEDLAARYLGIDEDIVFVVLGIGVAAYLFVFRRIILTTSLDVLVAAVVFLAASVAVDAFLESSLWRLGQWNYFVEDGLKWMGIAAWACYYVFTALAFTKRACASEADGESTPAT